MQLVNTKSRVAYKTSESFTLASPRGRDMRQVRLTAELSEGCGAILNEVAVQDRLFCGMKSIHYDRGKVQYYLCEDCYIQSQFPEGIQTKRG